MQQIYIKFWLDLQINVQLIKLGHSIIVIVRLFFILILELRFLEFIILSIFPKVDFLIEFVCKINMHLVHWPTPKSLKNLDISFDILTQKHTHTQTHKHTHTHTFMYLILLTLTLTREGGDIGLILYLYPKLCNIFLLFVGLNTY